MKIIQNPENGQVAFQLESNELYDSEEHLAALIEFTVNQAQIVFDLKSSYKKILQRLDSLQNEINQLKNGS
jgi:hypothetical protein